MSILGPPIVERERAWPITIYLTMDSPSSGSISGQSLDPALPSAGLAGSWMSGAGDVKFMIRAIRARFRVRNSLHERNDPRSRPDIRPWDENRGITSCIAGQRRWRSYGCLQEPASRVRPQNAGKFFVSGRRSDESNLARILVRFSRHFT
jgi:hypothetical protein